MSNSALYILNASAGSGKTYHLVKEYIKLLIQGKNSTSTFSGVIAMTFTNKAALEMKERIIAALYEISTNDTSNHKIQLLIQTLSKEIDASHQQVVSRSQNVLESILHQYEDFNVMTIDKFNLRLIKSFGLELDLPGEFEVIIDETELIEVVVDDLLGKLGDKEHKILSDLLLEYAKNNLNEGNKWNFRKNLVDFGAVLRNEKNNVAIEQLLELNLSTDTFKELIRVRKRIETNFEVLSKNVREKIDALDPKSLPGGKNTVNDIKALSSKSKFPIKNTLINPRLAGNFDRSDHKTAIPEEMKNAITELNQFWESKLYEFGALQLFMKNFFNMALLQYMAKALEAIKKEEQIVRISEFNRLISELIQGENAPYIYERLGVRFQHFLLDEFQDTSHLQWLNLVPLIHNSIGENLKNLIVGDPKQSIYRFKNGIAEQFIELPGIFNPEKNPKIEQKSAFFRQMGRVSELKNNWRSSPCIVKFNNAFFEELKTKMPSDSVDFYNSVHQNPMGEMNGRIEIHSKLMEKGQEINSEDLLPRIIEWIEECKSDGFKPSDICILGSVNKECNVWAIGLNNAGYRVVSADSLLIHSNLKVQLSIAYLKWRLRPSGETEKKRFAELYFRNNSKSYNDYKIYIKEKTSTSGKKYRYFDESSFLNDQFGGYSNFFFKFEDIYDLIQGFYKIIGFNELENPYLHHLAEITYEYGLKKGPNLKGFLEDYQRKKSKIAVQIPEAEDAIKIMTIHKSKGLEFPVVILPSLNFNLDIKSSFFVGIDDYLLYKKPTSSEVLKPLIDLHTKEKNQIITDKINLCYVAMTRPIERLYIQNDFDNLKFGGYFHSALKSTGLALNRDDVLSLVINDGNRSHKQQKVASTSLFEPKMVSNRLWFPDIAFQDNPALATNAFLSPEMQFGIQFHLMASRINSKHEIGSIIDDAVLMGEISTMNKEEITKGLLRLFENTEFQNLLNNSTKILNEQPILIDAKSTVRPDKIILKKEETIVVDFKTGMPKKSDQQQISNYTTVLSKMGLPKVSGYLYYSFDQRLEQVV